MDSISEHFSQDLEKARALNFLLPRLYQTASFFDHDNKRPIPQTLLLFLILFSILFA